MGNLSQAARLRKMSSCEGEGHTWRDGTRTKRGGETRRQQQVSSSPAPKTRNAPPLMGITPWRGIFS